MKASRRDLANDHVRNQHLDHRQRAFTHKEMIQMVSTARHNSYDMPQWGVCESSECLGVLTAGVSFEDFFSSLEIPGAYACETSVKAEFYQGGEVHGDALGLELFHQCCTSRQAAGGRLEV
jgi:hypothetical protein